MDCINLRQEFGRRYRVRFDPAYTAKGRPHAQRDPWMMVLPCRYGTIYPEGRRYLRIDLVRHNQIARRLASLLDCAIVNDGDDEKTVHFPLKRFSDVAAIVRPNRRPEFSIERREQMRERMHRIRQPFPNKSQKI